MIDIKVERRRKEFGITITGHAQYAEPGKDIVCSAISALFENLIQSIEELTDACIYHYQTEGWHQIYGNHAQDDATLLVESFRLGCMSIASAYPDHVQCAYVNKG